MQKTVECFYPGSSFPAISVTGAGCALDCKHCSKKYLSGMIPATTPATLLSISEALAERGAYGFLLSGGANSAGRVSLAEFADAIKDIKSTTDLKINAHIGLTEKNEIAKLVRSGVDSFSVDLYGSDDTIREVLGLDAKTDDYFEVVENLENAGAPIVAPHICIGIHGGKLKGELKAIDRLKKRPPRTLVFISLMPTKGTAYEKARPPGRDDVLSVIKKARADLPDTKLVLGCMRSKLDRTSEFDFVDAGLDGIVLPASRTVDGVREKGAVVKKRAICCSFV